MSGSLSQKVAMLESDLRAVKVIKPKSQETREFRDLEEVNDGWCTGTRTMDYGMREEMIEIPAITEPNSGKIDYARVQLEQIYDALSWYDFLLKRRVKKSLRSA